MKDFIHKFAVGMVCLFETKVKPSNLGGLYQRVFSNWCLSSNSRHDSHGRIVIAWKPGSYTVNIIKGTSQLLHCLIQLMDGVTGFFCSFVYGYNERSRRCELWENLRKVKTTQPWMICGDFNSIMHTDERIGSMVREDEIIDMRSCLVECAVQDIKTSGCLNTWNSKQEGISRVFSKIDRMVANREWQEAFE